jgi:NADH dehydrogenase FAD-containing subunit
MSILSDQKVKMIQGAAETIDRRAHALMLAGGEVLDCNIIIFGLGVVTNYFGIPGMEDFRTVLSRLTLSSGSRDICIIRSRMKAGQT